MKRGEIINTADITINGPRAREYGDASENFARIAALWSVIIGREITLTEVALCLDAVKTARLIVSPGHVDSWVDKIGYSALGGEVSIKEAKDGEAG